jgi:hypothetical protein
MEESYFYSRREKEIFPFCKAYRPVWGPTHSSQRVLVDLSAEVKWLGRGADHPFTNADVKNESSCLPLDFRMF